MMKFIKKIIEALFGEFNKDTYVVKEKASITIIPPIRVAVYQELLDLIAKHESNGIYDIEYGGKVVKLTEMTMSEVFEHQKDMLRRGLPSTAVGRYQFIHKTLKELVSRLDISGDQLFDKALQDLLAVALLKRRGYFKFMKGELTKAQFMLNLSKEWASFPKNIEGASYYSGDGLNKALVSPEEVLGVLTRLNPNSK